MADKSKNKNQISRRGMFSLLGITLLIPVVGFGNTVDDEILDAKDDEYQTLLKPDGTTVKVKVSTLKKSKVVKKNVSNKSFFSWLGKKL
jgi:hypothetical protein